VFWHDCWTAVGTLADVSVLSCMQGEASVYSVLSSPLRHAFVLRFTAVAAEEFVALSTLMAGVVLSTEADVRRCPWEDVAQKLSSSKLYGAVVSTGVGCEYYKFVWKNCTPPKVKFFGWLLVQNRIQTKGNLVKKNCLDNDACEICGSAIESAAHLIAGCAFSSGFWSCIGVDLTEDDVVNLWGVHPPVHLPTSHFNAFLLLCCWRMWKHRHDITFRSLPSCYNRLLVGCREDVDLWACRLPHADRHVALAWAEVFSSFPSAEPFVTDM
jgi:hypothetical protein